MAKSATRRLIRQPNGKVAVVFVDTATGKIITNLQGYKIIGQGENLPSPEENQTDEEKADEESEVLIRNRGERVLAGTAHTDAYFVYIAAADKHDSLWVS